MTTYNMAELLQLASTASFDALPIGDYDATVVEADATTSSTGKPMIKLKLSVDGGAYNGRKILTQQTLSAENAQALNIFFRFTRALGLPDQWIASLGVLQDLTPIASALVGRKVRVTLGQHDWQGETRNDVKKYTSLVGAAPLQPTGAYPGGFTPAPPGVGGQDGLGQFAPGGMGAPPNPNAGPPQFQPPQPTFGQPPAGYAQPPTQQPPAPAYQPPAPQPQAPPPPPAFQPQQPQVTVPGAQASSYVPPAPAQEPWATPTQQSPVPPAAVQAPPPPPVTDVPAAPPPAPQAAPPGAPQAPAPPPPPAAPTVYEQPAPPPPAAQPQQPEQPQPVNPNLPPPPVMQVPPAPPQAAF